MPSVPDFRFDADCDFAALVYGPTDQPDALLASFIHDLAAAGYDALGLVHRRPDPASAPRIVSLPDGAVIGGNADHLQDPAQLIEHCADWLRGVLARRPDLVAINRFGTLERRGEGLVPVIYEALEHDTPVLLAVPAALYDDWRAFSGGMAVRLDCDRASLDAWWRSLGAAPRGTDRPEDFCAQSK